MRTHSLFSPSRLAMLKKCPGWTGKAELTSDAQRGVDIHETITTAFIQGLEGHENPVIDYALSQLMKIRKAFPYAQFEAETPLNTGIPHVTGYADIIGIDSFDDAAILVELKTGYGDRPEAGDNIQLKGYAMALLREAGTVQGYLIEADQRKITTATWTKSDMPLIYSEIIGIISNSLNGGQPQAGGHCDFCSKAIICPSLESAVLSIQTAQEAISEAKTLTPAEVSNKLSDYWQRMELAEKYWANLKARAIAIIEAGGDVPGFSVKVTSGNRKWQDEQAALDSFINAGLDLSTVMQLQSPANVEKALKASGLKATEIKAMLSGLTVSGERRQLIPKGGEQCQKSALKNI